MLNNSINTIEKLNIHMYINDCHNYVKCAIIYIYNLVEIITNFVLELTNYEE